jgi:hypothetical protein
MISSVSFGVKNAIAIALLFFGTFLADPEREARIWVVPGSQVLISGTSNVNKFTCSYEVPGLEVPVHMVYRESLDEIHFKNANLQLESDCFDCGGKAINKDFKELLQTEKHPWIKLRLIYVDPPSPELKKVGVGMEITIAGISRTYVTELDSDQRGDIFVEGTLALKLTDFGLEPPKKVLGLIKVDDEVLVDLKLRLREL